MGGGCVNYSLFFEDDGGGWLCVLIDNCFLGYCVVFVELNIVVLFKNDGVRLIVIKLCCFFVYRVGLSI